MFRISPCYCTHYIRIVIACYEKRAYTPELFQTLRSFTSHVSVTRPQVKVAQKPVEPRSPVEPPW